MKDASSPWQSLIGAHDIVPALHGHKAAQLARLGVAGFPTPPGWVLPCDVVARVDADLARRLELGTDLLRISPGTHRWILRSSSPLEDQPGQSAAGLFVSMPAGAIPEDLAAALGQVMASARDPEVRALLGVKTDRIPLAVLAQPHLPVNLWTVEVDLQRHTWRAESWAERICDQRPFTAKGSLDASASADGSKPPGEHDRSELVRRAVELAERVARWAGEGGIWLLELGETEADRTEVGKASRGMVVLQLRPAPTRRVTFSADSGSRARVLPIEPARRDDVPRFPLHPGDESETWIWDAAHSPTPVCPLLAGLFTRWLRGKPASWPSRLIRGRWHDRARQSADPPVSELPWPPPEYVENALETWDTQIRARLRTRLDAMRARVSNLTSRADPWHAFVDEWLQFQTAYYEESVTEARRWAQSFVRHLGSLDPAGPPPPLPGTNAARRERELEAIVAALRRSGVGQIPTADAVARWAGDEPAGLDRRRVEEYLREHGHLAVIPWDGRSRTLHEDPWPLWRELAQRLRVPPQGPRGTRAWPPSPLSRDQQSAARLAVRVFARCEDDDDLLSLAYALLREGVTKVARSLELSPRAEELLEILPGDLEAILEAPDSNAWREAVARGRALALHWASWENDVSESDAVTRTGTAASPGRVTGRVRRLSAARDEGGPAAGEILVVPTITPADAMVFHRAAAIVCESGDALGHATILAREHGIPAVVGLGRARAWLSRTDQVLVDGDSGSVTRLRAEDL